MCDDLDFVFVLFSGELCQMAEQTKLVCGIDFTVLEAGPLVPNSKHPKFSTLHYWLSGCY